MNVYEIIANRVIEDLEKGEITWRKEWKSNGVPQNMVTKKPYRGINAILLAVQPYSSPYWLTFKQISNMGGKVKKGEHYMPVIYWNMIEKVELNESTKKMERRNIPILRYYKVWNVEQTEGIEIPKINTSFDPIAKAEEILALYKDEPKIIHGGDRAYYAPSSDEIHLPNKTDFTKSAHYYATRFHEDIHSTGHEKRLNRKEKITNISFGSENYSREELVAEAGSALLCGLCGIENTTLTNTVAYIQNWLKVLRNDKKMVVQAFSRAQRAVDYMVGNKFEDKEE